MANIEISDNELFELLGKKDCEIFTNEKTIAIFKAQFEKIKALPTEMATLKKQNTDLEASNKSLADKNIELDKVLTETRKERDAFKTEIDAKRLELARYKAQIIDLELEKKKKKKKKSR